MDLFSHDMGRGATPEQDGSRYQSTWVNAWVGMPFYSLSDVLGITKTRLALA